MPDAATQRQTSLELGFDSTVEREAEAKLYAPAAPPIEESPALQSVGIDQPTEIMNAAWQEVMGSLQTELSGPTYQNYLRHVRPLRLTSDKLTLSAPSDFVKDWLVRRFARRIEETLEQFLGRPVILGFQIVPEGADMKTESGSQDATRETESSTQSEIAPPQKMVATSTETADAPRRATKNEASAKSLDDFEDFSSPLNKKYTFDNFIVGRSNYVSHAAAWAVANAPAKGQYNPLFIYGGVGLGKTHLMQAIGHHINKVRGNPVEIAYVSGENFLYQVVRCIREDKMTAFRRKYRNVDIWLVDDIQYICNAERTEVEFFHIFNTLYDQGKQIVICSDKPPKDLQLTESRLISRFEWGLISYVEPPDLEHRIAILQRRAQLENVVVSMEVLTYLAEKIRSNIRSLEGSLTRLLAMASLDGRKINLDLASETVRYYSTSEAETVKVGVETIIEVVAEHFKIAVGDLLGKKRNKEIVMPRQVAMYLAREMASMSYPDIGRAFDRDYTTVIHSYEKVKGELKRDSSLRGTISEVRSRAHARA
ncbi:chromosomal replication initiator protein DnaA [Abditibacterium utsteinense]|uniref:Chromosomal replication initiator protein DnaA n=1 Tax=Abditibacterium utsteinense TaxID=1960156 RepID=A0A2S8SSM4_9BACT|nr:chromosomal replication initiator protein DnaA [Abditibacterium utsteinense]PQV63787.1 chromosomal replication initiator protein DnaA [Abditibacterium utsteinense]